MQYGASPVIDASPAGLMKTGQTVADLPRLDFRKRVSYMVTSRLPGVAVRVTRAGLFAAELVIVKVAVSEPPLVG